MNGFDAPALPGLNTSPGRIMTQVTPSYQPSTPFGALMAEKKGLLDTIAEVAQKAADVASVIKSPTGTRVQLSAARATPFSGIMNSNSIFTNPLFVAGIAVALALYLKK